MTAAEDLVGFTEIASTLRVAKSTAARYTKRSDFPTPVGRLVSGPVWRRSDVEAWAKANLPLRTGRPPKPAV
jgi:predicted DNA-binding transcriptional regulator AlpA